MGVDGEGIPARAETMATGKDAGDMLVCASDHKQFSVPNGFKSIVPNRAWRVLGAGKNLLLS